jgi:hypothetical protein
MIYITKDYKNIFFINLKCCYSLFENQLVKKGNILKLNKGYNNSLLDETILDKISEDVKLYLIIRSPYSRFCSFFIDKFISCFSNKYNEQLCHKKMYDYYDKEHVTSSKFTIPELIDAMKRGYNEGHIYPQSDILKYNIFKKDITVLRLEDPTFTNKCRSILKCKFPVDNYTGGGKKTSMLSLEDTEFIKEYYKDDFTIYSMDIIQYAEPDTELNPECPSQKLPEHSQESHMDQKSL